MEGATNVGDEDLASSTASTTTMHAHATAVHAATVHTATMHAATVHTARATSTTKSTSTAGEAAFETATCWCACSAEAWLGLAVLFQNLATFCVLSE